MFGVESLNKAAEGHVNRGGVKGWCDENKNSLHDKTAKGLLIKV